MFHNTSLVILYGYQQVKETLLQKFLEVEQTAKEQATDNAILDQLQKVLFFLCQTATICGAFH